ncbi:MAG: hypothetical protein ACYDGW_12265 [Vulcanimicrobiaceae bacterium]
MKLELFWLQDWEDIAEIRTAAERWRVFHNTACAPARRASRARESGMSSLMRKTACDAQIGLPSQKRVEIKPQDATSSNRMTQEVGRLRQTKHDVARVGGDAIGDRVEHDPPARSAEPR